MAPPASKPPAKRGRPPKQKQPPAQQQQPKARKQPPPKERGMKKMQIYCLRYTLRVMEKHAKQNAASLSMVCLP